MPTAVLRGRTVRIITTTERTVTPLVPFERACACASGMLCRKALQWELLELRVIPFLQKAPSKRKIAKEVLHLMGARRVR